MKPAPFAYHCPADADEALSLLGELGDDAKFLAGGQSLVPLLALRLTRFDHLIDLNRASDLGGISIEDSQVRVGSMVRQTEVVRSAALTAQLALLPLASRLVGHFQIRNRGTIGGSVAHADPSAEYPAVVVALDATIELRSVGGARSVAASDFFVSTFVTAMEPDEILAALRFPLWASRSGFGIAEAARRAGDFAIAGAVAGVELGSDERLTKAAVALFGVAPTPFRATSAESGLFGRSPSELTEPVLAEIGHLAAADIEPPADVHGSSAYRKHLAGVMASRAIGDALVAAAAGRP